MLTPQEVSERVFPKASFGGYHMAQVDEFLDLLTEDYTALYSENAVLKSKMKVLVDKVEEYRSTENAMRKALMTAQRMADDTVKEAEQRRDEIIHQAEQRRDEMLTQAEEKANAQIRDLQQQIAAEEYRLAQAQKTTAEYVSRMKDIHNKSIAYLDSLKDLLPPQEEVAAPAEEPVPQTDPVEDTVSEIDENVQRLLAKAMGEVIAERNRQQIDEAQPQEDQEDTIPLPDLSEAQEEGEQPQADEEEPSPAASRIDFGNLQFGRDYEIQ